MQQLLFLLVILACPLMMRGSHGGHGDHMSGDNADHAQAMGDSDARIAQLERQVASLQARLEERDSTPAAGRR